MGLFQVLVPFLVTWLAIHLFLFLLQRFLNRPKLPVGPGSGPEYELLPTIAPGSSGQGITTESDSGSNKAAAISFSSSGSGLLVQPFYIRFSTTALNSFFFKLGNHPRLQRFWRVWYGLGVVFGMLAMIFGWALLGYAAIKLISLSVSHLLALWPLRSGSWSRSQEDQVSSALVNKFRKRDLSSEPEHSWSSSSMSNQAGSAGNDDMVLVPVIPGVTLPLSHLPYYLIALLVSGVVHEAGHAIAAAREKTQVSTTGIFLYIVYPGAFVDFSTRAMATMNPLQQLRVICAGVWHNVVLFALAWVFLSTGALQLTFRIVGWREMSDGLSVVDVAENSPLFDGGHLKPGFVITKVNDIPLQGDPLYTWNRSLLDSTTSEALEEASEQPGFCIPDGLLYVKPLDCCLFNVNNTFGHDKDPHLSCFTPVETPQKASIPHSSSEERILAADGHCLPSADILGNPNPTRCSITAGQLCDPGSTCLRPFNAYTTATMIRLYYSIPSWMSSSSTKEKNPSVVLYQGDPKDIWEAVQVTSIGKRWSFLPLWFPNAILLTIRYTMSFSLALSMLNIVPARHLDGHHALKAVAALIFIIRQSYRSTQSYYESALECLVDNGVAMTAATSGLSTATFPKGTRAVKGVVASTTALLGFVIVGSMLQLIVSLIWQ